jgi:hypothetical protein
LFVSSVLFVFWYHSPNFLDTRRSSTLSLTLAIDGGEWSTPHPTCFTPGKETQYPLYVEVYD